MSLQQAIEHLGTELLRRGPCSEGPEEFYRRLLLMVYRRLSREIVGAGPDDRDAGDGGDGGEEIWGCMDRLRWQEAAQSYESLLELHPEIEGGRLRLHSAAGHQRKTSGSYYTPASLVECLLDSALEPVLAQAARAPDAEQAILALTVCDPACGSGHFLVAAARRIARRLATVRGGTDERAALREVIGRCLYGVDRSETAVELCRMNLWRGVLEQGAPLPVLDRHVVVGNSLVGVRPDSQQDKLRADAFCAAVWTRTGAGVLGPAEIELLAVQQRFLHYHLAFPEVFQGRAAPGFDVVLGNPPWERIKLQEKEFFAWRRPDIAGAKNAAARKQKIEALQQGSQQDRALYQAFQEALRAAEGEARFVRRSGRYPLCGRGDINLYAAFAETNRMILSEKGYVGCIVPSGIATDDTTKHFFADLVRTRSLKSLYDFQNAAGLFAGVHRSYKFCLLTLAGSAQRVRAGIDFFFFARQPADLQQEERHFTLSAEEIGLLNPNTRTCPVFRSQRDADLTKSIYRLVPVLIEEGAKTSIGGGNPWGLRLSVLFHMANDSGRFRDRRRLLADGYLPAGNRFHKGDEVFVPLYEAKMLHHSDHRFGDYGDCPEGGQALPDVPQDRLRDPDYVVQPRYWVSAGDLRRKLPPGWDREWLLGWRDICRNTDERTVISAFLPLSGCGDTVLLMFPSPANLPLSLCLHANLNSLVLDYAARQKVGGTHLKYHVFRQLPVLPPKTYAGPAPWAPGQTLAEWLRPRVLELVYTAWDLAPLARDLGYPGPPFRWDAARRLDLRCELDAAFFHLYQISRGDAAHILDSFPIVRRDDQRAHGEYRRRRVILEIYDALSERRAPRSCSPSTTA